jgi:hypothetical protein
VDGWYTAWNFPNTLLFTLSIMTTIGYGQIAPKEHFSFNYSHKTAKPQRRISEKEEGHVGWRGVVARVFI